MRRNMSDAALLGKLNKFCQNANMLEQYRISGRRFAELLMAEWVRRYADELCVKLSSEKSFSPEVAQHMGCCLHFVLRYRWFPIDERRIIAKRAARTLASEITVLEKRKASFAGLPAAGSTRLEALQHGLRNIAHWANLDLPQPTLINLAGKDYSIPPKWDDFFQGLGAAGM